MAATTDRDLRRLAFGTLFPGFEGVHAPPWLLELADEGLRGVVLFERNVSPADPDGGVAALTARLWEVCPDVLVAVDEEGGDVTRLDHRRGSDVPGSAALGVVDDPALTRRVGAHLGARLHAAGVTLNLAPVADVDADPRNPIIGIRSFGSSPERVARHVAAFVEGQQQHRVAATVKHFPGHGATTEDSHYTVPWVSASREVLDARELVPFRAAVAAGTQVVMTAHVRYPALDERPATLSQPIVTDLLRRELGFAGVVMSDGLDMHAISRTVGQAEGAVQALAAGVDALCIGGDSTGPEMVELLVGAITGAVTSGRLSVDRLRDASARVDALAAWCRGGDATPLEDVGATFPDDAPGREAARRAVGAHGVTPLTAPALVLECHDEPGMAAGDVPWAIGAALSARMPGTVVVRLSSDEADPRPSLARDPDRPVVVSVRGLRRRPWQRDVLAAVRALRPDVVVVEHDLPGDPGLLGAHYLLTYSGSRVSAEVAADLLAGVPVDR
jgi:beta-N-acetylhexosaminidase